VPFLSLRSTERNFIGIAILNSCPPKRNSGCALLRFGNSKIAVKIVEVLHFLGEDVG